MTPRALASIPTVPATRAYIQLGVVILIWGGYFVVAKKAVNQADPLALAVARYVVAGSVLAALALRTARPPRLHRREVGIITIMALSSIFAFNVLALWGLEFATASDSALIMPTMPALVTVPVAAVAFGERFGRWQIAGLALLLVGEGLVFQEVFLASKVSGERLLGIGFFMTAAILWGVYTIATRALGGRLGPVVTTFYAVAIGLVPLVIVGGLPFVRMVTDGPNPGLLAAIAYLGVLHTVLGFIWWYEGVHAVGAGRAAVINTLVPVVALTLATVFLDETPSAARAVGSLVVVAGVALAVSAGRRADSAAAVPPD